MADAGEFIQIDDKTGTDSRFFCTCFANQDETQLHGGVSDRSYLSGQLIGDRVLSASADASQGKGFAAAAGDMPIQLNDPTGSLLASLLNGSWQLVGGCVWIAYREPDGTMRKLYQLTVTDYASEDGTILVICKTPSYLQSQLLHKSASVTTLSTDPDDPANPTDPNYLVVGSQSVSAGAAFGGVPVSLKAGDPLSVCRAAYFTRSTFRSGDISVGTGEAYRPYLAARRVTKHTYNADGSIATVGAVLFDCRGASTTTPDTTERDRFQAEIQAFITAGYRFVVSNGKWFVDVTANTGGAWAIVTHSPGSPVMTYGGTWGAYTDTVGPDIGIWIVLANAEGDELYPPDDLDPSGIGIYFVPKAIPVASMQIVIDGFARDSKTIQLLGVQQSQDGITTLTPAAASESNFFASKVIRDLGLCFYVPSAGNHVGGIFDSLNSASTLSGSGDIANIKTDPDHPFAGGLPPIAMQVADNATGNVMSASLRIKPTAIDPTIDFTCVESTWEARFDVYGFSHPTTRAKIWGPLDASPSIDRAYTMSTGGIKSVSQKAKRTAIFPNWKTMRDASLVDPEGQSSVTNSPAVQGDWCHGIQMFVYECFVFGFSKFGFTDIYSTVYPFWTRKSCASLAYGAGTIIAGGTGRGTAIQANGAITWSPFDLPVPVGGVAAITGTAYGALGSVPIWVSVGTITVGSTVTPTAWLSWDDGVTWEVDATYQTSSNPTQVRFFNGKFIATRADGKIDLAAGFATPHLIWTQTVTGATQLNDIAFGTGRYLMVGNGGQARYSSDLVTFSDWVYPAGDDLLCVAYSQSSIGGFFHVGYGTPSGGGTIFRKYDGSVTTWVPYNLPGGDSVVSIADCDGDVLAVSSGGSIWARSPGYVDVTWKQRLGLGIETYHDRFGILIFPLEGRNHIVVGGPAQIATSNTFNQGSSASYYGIGIPDWTPWGTKTPAHAMQFLEAQFMGGTADNWNPIQWQRAGYPITESFGLAVDPPSTSESGQSGTTALDAARQICEEWWIFAGDMAALYIDGSTDNIEDPDQSDPTAIALGNIEDCFTQITAQYQPFGGDYLGKAYIQNVDVAYVAGNDAFYFAGWDDAGNTFGLALWEACRAAYLETGIIRDTSMNFDSIQSASSMGAALAMTSAYLGDRIDWICRRPKYYTVTIDGNESAAAQAHVGSFYKVNPIFLTERSLALGGAYGTGLIVNESHNITTGKHTLEMAFKP